MHASGSDRYLHKTEHGGVPKTWDNKLVAKCLSIGILKVGCSLDFLKVFEMLRISFCDEVYFPTYEFSRM